MVIKHKIAKDKNSRLRELVFSVLLSDFIPGGEKTAVFRKSKQAFFSTRDLDFIPGGEKTAVSRKRKQAFFSTRDLDFSTGVVAQKCAGGGCNLQGLATR